MDKVICISEKQKKEYDKKNIINLITTKYENKTKKKRINKKGEEEEGEKEGEGEEGVEEVEKEKEEEGEGEGEEEEEEGEGEGEEEEGIGEKEDAERGEIEDEEEDEIEEAVLEEDIADDEYDKSITIIQDKRLKEIFKDGFFDLKHDTLFKTLFGNDQNIELSVDFINSILNYEEQDPKVNLTKENLKFGNNEIYRSKYEEKQRKNYVDVHAYPEKEIIKRVKKKKNEKNEQSTLLFEDIKITTRNEYIIEMQFFYNNYLM